MAEDNYFNMLFSMQMQRESYVAIEIPDIVYNWILNGQNSSIVKKVKMFLDLERNQLAMAKVYLNSFPYDSKAQKYYFHAWHEVLYTMNRFSVKGSIYYMQDKYRKYWEDYIKSLSWHDFFNIKPNRLSHYFQFAIQKYVPSLNSTLMYCINSIHWIKKLF